MTLCDPEAPRLSLRLEAGRISRGYEEFFFLGNGFKRVLLDASTASHFLGALWKLNFGIQRGRLLDRTAFNFQITDTDGGSMGIELGVKAGHAYVGIDNARVNISDQDLNYLNAACASCRHLAGGGLGVAMTPQPRTRGLQRPIWQDFSSRFCNNGAKCWYED